MLRALVVLPLFLSSLIACSKDQPAPVAPAGKARSIQGVPTDPSNLHVEALIDTSVRVVWDRCEGASDYDINYKELPGGRWTNWPHRGATRLHSTIYGLQPNTEYRWAVRAENSDGPSAWVFGENFQTLPLIEPPLVEGFQIELVFVDSFTVEERSWLEDVAQRWELFFNDQPDYIFPLDINLDAFGHYVSIPIGEVIDDLRIYVRKGFRLNHPGWDQKAGAGARVLFYRDDRVTPVVAVIGINDQSIEDDIALVFGRYTAAEQQKVRENMYWKKRFHHELGHAFGIGASRAWRDHVEEYRLRDPHTGRMVQAEFYTGPNALREYQAIHPSPHDKGIPVGKNSFSEEVAAHWLPLGELTYGEIGLTLFEHYFNIADGTTNISRVSLGVLEDIGWSVRYDAALPKLLDNEYLGVCWIQEGRYSWLDFQLDCP